MSIIASFDEGDRVTFPGVDDRLIVVDAYWAWTGDGVRYRRIMARRGGLTIEAPAEKFIPATPHDDGFDAQDFEFLNEGGQL